MTPFQTVGTCSLCGGPVSFQQTLEGTVRRCNDCGSTPKLPVIEMEKPQINPKGPCRMVREKSDGKP